jgi:hypothetical protein
MGERASNSAEAHAEQFLVTVINEDGCGCQSKQQKSNAYIAVGGAKKGHFMNSRK